MSDSFLESKENWIDSIFMDVKRISHVCHAVIKLKVAISDSQSVLYKLPVEVSVVVANLLQRFKKADYFYADTKSVLRAYSSTEFQ